MRWTFIVSLVVLLLVGSFLSTINFIKPTQYTFLPNPEGEDPTTTVTATTSLPETIKDGLTITDIEPQSPLQNPPTTIKGIYATSWSASSAKKMDYLINLIDTTELNAIVIDIKDYSGYVTYDITVPDVRTYHAYEVRIPKINALIKKLHDKNIYVIARLATFQDGRLALARPDLAMQSSSTGKVWQDKKRLTWMDPASLPIWDYNIAIAKDALSRGFDEVNFDYIRFATDGAISDIKYPAWNGVTPRATVIRDFWRYVRTQIPDRAISADIFGLASVSYDDLGIGQKIENAFGAFDAIAPMVYPSHYYSGTLGFQNPADHPYEVVLDSITKAVARLKLYNSKQTKPITATSTAFEIAQSERPTTIRPWLQDFNLGATYDATKVRAQIQAVYDAASTTPELISGWMLWNPSNVYTKEALELTDN